MHYGNCDTDYCLWNKDQNNLNDTDKSDNIKSKLAKNMYHQQARLRQLYSTGLNLLWKMSIAVKHLIDDLINLSKVNIWPCFIEYLTNCQIVMSLIIIMRHDTDTIRYHTRSRSRNSYRTLKTNR